MLRSLAAGLRARGGAGWAPGAGQEPQAGALGLGHLRLGEGQAEGLGEDVPLAPAAALPPVVTVRLWHTSLMLTCVGLTW